VDRPGSEQTVLRLLLPAPAWPAARDPAYRAFVQVLGGTFTSRLNTRLREEMGVTYGVSTGATAWRAAGVLAVSTSVDAPATGDALAAILEEMRRIAAGGVTAEETSKAVESLRSDAAQGFGDLAGTLGAFLPYAVSGGGPGGLAEDLAALGGVTPAAVDAAAAAHASLDGGVLVLVGDRAVILPALAAVGLPAPTFLTPAEALSYRP
jgi:predicted Zn-dependent peptidase